MIIGLKLIFFIKLIFNGDVIRIIVRRIYIIFDKMKLNKIKLKLVRRFYMIINIIVYNVFSVAEFFLYKL